MLGHIGFYNTATIRTHVRFQFSTHAAAGGNIAPLSAFEAADLRIYKATDGAAFSATQRSSSAGITMTSPFDSLTGVHDVDIDLTDNTDSGFYAAGSSYTVVLSPDSETVDGQTITGVVLCYFEIGPQPVNVTQWGGSATPVTNINTIYNTDYATVYDSTNKAFLSKLGNFAMGGSSLNLTTGTIATGAQTLSSVTVTNAFTISDGLIVNASTTNRSAIAATGNGTGCGLLATSGSGATGDGIKGVSVATLGNGIAGDGNGATGAGFYGVAAYGFYGLSDVTNGHGFHGKGNTDGSGGFFMGGNNGDGIAAQGHKAGAGIAAHGGADGGAGVGAGPGFYAAADSTGPGCQFSGGATSGSAFVLATTDGYTLQMLPNGTNKHCVVLSPQGTDSCGILAQSTGSYPVIYAIAGATGNCVNMTTTSGHGILIDANGSGKDAVQLIGENYAVYLEGGPAAVYAYAGAVTAANPYTGVIVLNGDGGAGDGGAMVSYVAESGTDILAFNAPFAAGFFNVNSGTTYGSAVSGSVVKETADNAGGSSLTVQDIVDGVLDELLSAHTDSGSVGEGIGNASSAGDPWGTALPGAYSSGTAGYLVGTYVNASISAVKAKTDSLTFTVANKIDANVYTWNGTAVTTPNTAGTPIVDVGRIAGTSQTAKDLGAINVTNLNTLSGHDPGATLSSLTQTQVTGGAYALNSSSFAFNSAFDFTTTQKTSIGTAVAASAVASVTGNVGGNVTGSVGSVVGAVGSVTGNVGGNVTGSVGSVVGLTASNLDATVSSRAAATDLATVAGYLDTEIADIKSKTDNLPASFPTNFSALAITVGGAVTAGTVSDKTGFSLTSGERDSIAAALLDLSDGVETGLTLRQAQRVGFAANAGKLSGAAGTTVTIRNYADTKDRITATVDADGNRSAISLDLT